MAQVHQRRARGAGVVGVSDAEGRGMNSGKNTDMNDGDPIRRYLSQLRAGLPARDTERILAEAEDHLRETATAGLAVGLTEAQAQEAAISSFGSVRAVVRAHSIRPGNLVRGRTRMQVLGDLILSAWKLGGIGLTAIGVSGLVVALMNVTLGRSFVGQVQPGVTFSRASCVYWMAAWTHAHTCAQAAMLEASSDAVILRGAAGVLGLAVLATYVAWRTVMGSRGTGPGVLLAGYFPVLAAGVFGAGALGLGLAQLVGFNVSYGPGFYLSGAIVAAVVAVGYGSRARPALRHLAQTWLRQVRN